VKFSNNIPICDVLLHAGLTGMKICFMMIGSVVVIRENVCCPSTIHELPRPSIFSLPPLWLSPTPTQWMLMSLFPGAKRPRHEAYHFPPFNDETKKVSLFHMHLACDQGRVYTLAYLMLYVRVGRKIDIHCEAGCCPIDDPRLCARTSSHALDVT